MKSKQRVLKALNLEAVDKAPFHAYESPEHAIRLLGRKAHEMYLEPEIVAEAMINAAKKYSNDIIYMRHGVYLPENHEAVKCEDGLCIRERKSGETVGHVLSDTKDFIPVKTGRPQVESVKDIEKIPIVASREILETPQVKSLKRYIEEFKGQKFIFGFACGQSANAIDSWMGTENAMISALTDPGLCRAVMDRKYEALKEEMLALKELGADGVYTGDACASCSFFSPDIYCALFFEYQKKSIDFAHGHGMKALLHICGKISPILENMADTGADVIESLDAISSGGDIDLKDAKKRVGRRVCLKGNIDAIHVLAQLSPREIYNVCSQALNDAGPAGYILSTEQITRDTPPENVMAMIQARDDFKV